MKTISYLYIALLAVFSGTVLTAAPPGNGVQKLHLIQDDAQDYMVSRIYQLKYVQANDILPFVLSMVMRYNVNSSASSLAGENNAQLLTVTCPAEMMQYVTDFVAKADRNIPLADKKSNSDIIKGTGITREVYQPNYRSGEALLNVLINSAIGAGPHASVYAWDKNSNQIYWKDNSSNSDYVLQFLTFLDRPPPQIDFHFKLYEIRASRLRDLGLEYLAWKNGPGLNLLQVGFDAFSISSAGSAALSAVSGPAGGFFFAPQFDMSFIRLLGQSGNAEIVNEAHLSVSNSDTDFYEIYFNPQLQNIIKSSNDRTSVTVGTPGLNPDYKQLYLKIQQPIVNIHYGQPQSGYPASEAFTVKAYTPGDYSQYPGTVYFGYDLQSAYVVERNNLGTELLETNRINSALTIDLNEEVIIGKWHKQQYVKETVGVPYLSDIPILKYLFSTTTESEETVYVYLTVEAKLLNTAAPSGHRAGELIAIQKKRETQDD